MAHAPCSLGIKKRIPVALSAPVRNGDMFRLLRESLIQSSIARLALLPPMAFQKTVG